MLSFPGRHLAPKGLPASRRYSPRQAELRPHSRAVQRLTVAGFRVRPLSSLGLAFAAPACEPDKDTFVTLAPRLYHLTPGRPPLVAVRWPGVTGLTSYLSGCIWLTSQRCFYIAGVLEGRAFAEARFLPGAHAHFVSPFGVFHLADWLNPPESCVPCWHTVATVYPLGNCDSLKLETSLSYLTRIGTASRPFSLSS